MSLSLGDLNVFMEQTVLALVSKNVKSKVNVAYFQNFIKERPSCADALLNVEFPAKVDRWDGGSEDSSYALLTFRTTDAAAYFKRKFPQHCLSLKMVANVPSTTSPAVQADIMARKRLQRDQQTFAQRSLALVPTPAASASASDELRDSVRRQMEALGVTVESVLWPVDCSSVGLHQEAGQCAVVTFGKHSEVKKAESALKDDGQNIYTLPPQVIDSCIVFVPKSTLEKLATKEGEKSIEDAIQMLRHRFGLAVMYSSNHESCGMQGHWLRIRALCDYINGRVSAGPRLDPQAATADQGEDRFERAGASPNRKVAKVVSQGQRQQPLPAGGAACDSGTRPSSSHASSDIGIPREPEQRRATGQPSMAQADSDEEDHVEFFATCQSPDDIDRLNAIAAANYEQQQQQQEQRQKEEEEEEKEEEPQHLDREKGAGQPQIHLERVPVAFQPDAPGSKEPVSLPVPQAQGAVQRDHDALKMRATVPRRNDPVEKRVECSRVVIEYLMERLDIAKALENEFRNRITVEIAKTENGQSFVIESLSDQMVGSAYAKLWQEVQNAQSAMKQLQVLHYDRELVRRVVDAMKDTYKGVFVTFDEANTQVVIISERASTHIAEVQHRLEQAAVHRGDVAEGGGHEATLRQTVPTSSLIARYLIKFKSLKYYLERNLKVEVSMETGSDGSTHLVIEGSDQSQIEPAYMKLCEAVRNAESAQRTLEVPQYHPEVVSSVLKEEEEAREDMFADFDQERKCVYIICEDVGNCMREIQQHLMDAAVRGPPRESSPSAASGIPHAAARSPAPERSAAANDSPPTVPEVPSSVPHKKYLYVNSEYWQYILACKRENIEFYMDMFGVEYSTGEKTSRGVPVCLTGSSSGKVQSVYEAVSDIVDKCAEEFAVESFKVDLNVVNEAMLKEHRTLVLIIVDEGRQKIKLKGHGVDVAAVKAKIKEACNRLAEANKSAEHDPSPAFAPSPPLAAASSVSSLSPAPASSPVPDTREKTFLASVRDSGSSVSDEVDTASRDVPVREDVWRYMRMCMTSDLERLQKRYSVTFKALSLKDGSPPVIRIRGEEEDSVVEAARSLENVIKKTEESLYIESIKYKDLNEQDLIQAVRDLTAQYNLEIAFKVFEERKKVQLSGKEKDVIVCSQHLKRLIRGEAPPPSASASFRSTRSARSLYEEPKPEVPSVLPKSFKSALSPTLVHVIEKDITTMAIDVIVNAANENLVHGGGVAAAIRQAAGEELVRDCDEYMEKTQRGVPMRVCDNYFSAPGRLRCTYVMHAVGPSRADYNDLSACGEDLMKTVLKCLSDVHHRRLKSIALPAISAGIFGVPPETVAAAIAQALGNFLQQFENTPIQDIYLVDTDPVMVTLLQQTVGQQFLLAAEAQYCGVGASPGVRRPASSTPPPQCAVCLEAIKDCKTLPLCQHSFCRACIDQVFRTGKRECPMCRVVYE